MKEKLREKLELEKRALQVVERLLEESVAEDFLVDCVCVTFTNSLTNGFMSNNDVCMYSNSHYKIICIALPVILPVFQNVPHR